MIKFKNTRLELEFDNLLDEHLKGVINLLQDWLNPLKLDDPIMITSIWRSESENKKVGGHPHSKHLLKPSKAIDIRTWHLKEDALKQIQLLLLMLRKCGVPISHVLHEDKNKHLHIQLND